MGFVSGIASGEPRGGGKEAAEDRGCPGTHRTPSLLPSMIIPPPLPARERVMTMWSPWTTASRTSRHGQAQARNTHNRHVGRQHSISRARHAEQARLTPNALELGEVRVLVPLQRRLDRVWGPISRERPEARRHARERPQTDEFPRFVRACDGACRREGFDGHPQKPTLDFSAEHGKRGAHSREERADVRAPCERVVSDPHVLEREREVPGK